MVLTSAQQAFQGWQSASHSYGKLSNLQSMCNVCGGQHSAFDHWEFMQTMPQDPVDLVDDLVKMGLYKQNQLRAADSIN